MKKRHAQFLGLSITASLLGGGCLSSPPSSPIPLSLWPLFVGLDYTTEYSVEVEVEPASLNALAEPGSAVQIHFDIRGTSPPVALACHTDDGVVGISLVAEKADDDLEDNNEDLVVAEGEWEPYAIGDVLTGQLRGLGTQAWCDEGRRGNAVLATVSSEVCGRVGIAELSKASQDNLLGPVERLAVSEGFDLGATCYNPDGDEERVEPEHVVVRLDDN
jgi:hypothetical protein